MDIPKSTETDVEARRLHAARCIRYGIHDDDRIALYWQSCDQDMYRRMAAIRAQTDQ